MLAGCSARAGQLVLSATHRFHRHPGLGSREAARLVRPVRGPGTQNSQELLRESVLSLLRFHFEIISNLLKNCKSYTR